MGRLKSKEKREKTLWVMWSKNPCVQSIKLQEVEVVGLLTEPSFHMAAHAAEVIPRTQVLLADPLLTSWRTASLFLVALCVDNVALSSSDRKHGIAKVQQTVNSSRTELSVELKI